MNPPNMDTIQQLVTKVSDQHYAMTGAVIATSAAQVTALGEACVQISLDHQVDTLDWQEVSQRIEKIAQIKKNLLTWFDHEMSALAEYTLYLQQDKSASQHPMCESYAKVCQLSIDVVNLLQEFRPSVLEELHDDMEIAIQLLTGITKAASTLLNGKLKNCSDKSLLQKYEPVLENLKAQIDRLHT